jgi:hypothetical protein
MNEQNARIRINFSTREIEVEGTESFVREYAAKLEDPVNVLMESFVLHTSGSEDSETQGSVSSVSMAALPSSFGEYLHQFTNSIKNVDQVLVAGYYAQCKASDGLFSAKDVRELLAEQGISLINTAARLGDARKAKRIFVKDGKYKVSKTGKDHISSLLAAK